MKKYLELIRIKHWIKNILIFIPMVSAKMLNLESIYLVLGGFFSFSLMTSFVYIINDIRDIEKDKLHPRKKNRPLPSGKIKKIVAIYIAILMIILSIIINTFINKSIINIPLYFLLAYVIINLAYSFGLKNIAIVDIAILSTGFILRVYYGASLLNIEVSTWLFLTILNASLFLGFGKRKKEFIQSKDTRKVLKQYNEDFLDKFQYLSLTLMLVFYSLWATSQNKQLLFLTIPMVMIIFMKYCLAIEKGSEGDPTTILYQDKSLLILCGIYGCIMLLFMIL